MKFNVKIDNKYLLTYVFNKFTGIIKIYIDNRLMKRDMEVMYADIVKSWTIRINNDEIVIRRKRPLLLAFLRESKYDIIYNGNVIKTLNK